MQHQARWMKSTRFSRPKGHFGTALTYSVPFGILTALAAWGLGWPEIAWAALLWSIGSRMLLAAAANQLVLTEKSPWRGAMLYPVRDLLGIFFWIASYSSRKIFWRNEVYILEDGGRMRRQSPNSRRAAPAETRSPLSAKKAAPAVVKPAIRRGLKQ